jgi:hypothetical protein
VAVPERVPGTAARSIAQTMLLIGAIALALLVLPPGWGIALRMSGISSSM